MKENVEHLAIFGGRGGGEIASDIVSRRVQAGSAVSLAGYLNDVLPRGYELLGGEVLGTFKSWISLPNHVRFVAPLHKSKEMRQRFQILKALEVPDERWTSIIDPTAIIADNTVISGGCVISPLTVLGPSSRLGQHVGVWPGAQIGHDAEIEDFVFIGRQSLISGYCRVAMGAFIGSGSIILENCSVGRFAVVGAGSIIVADVPDNAIVAGRPGRIIGVLPSTSAS